jgi:hypothetical protein
VDHSSKPADDSGLGAEPQRHGWLDVNGPRPTRPTTSTLGHARDNRWGSGGLNTVLLARAQLRDATPVSLVGSNTPPV